MSERIRRSYDDALYKSTFTLRYFTLDDYFESKSVAVAEWMALLVSGV